jgi:hypothetical protein
LATVDAEGIVVALAAGSLTVSARVDDIVREIPVTITAPPGDLVEVPSISAETETDQAQAEPAQPQAGRPQPEGPPVAERDPDPEPEAETPDPDPVPPPPDGYLELTIFPQPARVEIDGELQGENLRSLPVSLEPGPHRLRLENPRFIPVDTVITIASGDTLSLRLILQRREG